MSYLDALQVFISEARMVLFSDPLGNTRTKGGCDDGENRFVTVPSLICFDHNGTIWKVSVGTGTVLRIYWASSATE